MPRKGGWSDITCTDQFCGAGGSSLGAVKAGLRVRMALNHWRLAIDTHNTNFPDTDHDCTDISACDPRRYPSTDILITSPECTTHSPAGGNRQRIVPQRDIFLPDADDASTVRSRATMWDVPRFSEYHRYNIVIVENVVEVLRWELFHTWLQAMHVLGYRHRVVCLNSMFAHPTPQSRDRVYIVFWKAKNRAPDLDISPVAPCPKCGRNVLALQQWKNGRTVGKYKRQYVYACPDCQTQVLPYYYAALNAIDFSLPAERIGDRRRALRPRTLERIRYGLEKFGRRPLVVRTNMTSGVGCRVRAADEEPLDAQPASNITALVSPFLLNGHMSRRVYGVDEPMAAQAASREHDSLCFVVANRAHNTPRGIDDALAPVCTGQHHLLVQDAATVSPFIVGCANDGGKPDSRARGADDPLATVHAGGGNAALILPFVVETAHTQDGETRVRGTDEPLATQSAQQSAALVSPFLVALRGTDDSQRSAWSIPPDAPVGTVSAGGVHHGIVQGAALLSLRDSAAMHVGGLDEPTMTQTAQQQAALLARAPFLVSHYRTNQATPIDAPVPSVTTVDRHELVQPAEELSVDDCYFRMLQPHEIGAAMAFPSSYTVLGNKRDRVKQYGNAVTPPAMEILIDRCVASLAHTTHNRRTAVNV